MKIGFIGVGNMGGAILSGYASSEASNGVQLAACGKTRTRCDKIRETIPSLEVYESTKDLCRDCDVILLGVKPQFIEGVLEEIAPAYTAEKLVISMAAGVEIDSIKRYLGGDSQIVRVMPNTPALVGEAITAVCRGDGVEDKMYDTAMEIFNSIGKAEAV